MRQLTPQFTLISAERKEYTIDQNRIRTEKVMKLLNDKKIPYKTVLGRYKYDDETVANETTFVIPDSFDKYKSVVWDIMREFGQESFLYVNEKRQGFIQFSDGKRKNLGQFREASEKKALKSDCHTFDYKTNKYYICD